MKIVVENCWSNRDSRSSFFFLSQPYDNAQFIYRKTEWLDYLKSRPFEYITTVNSPRPRDVIKQIVFDWPKFSYDY